MATIDYQSLHLLIDFTARSSLTDLEFLPEEKKSFQPWKMAIELHEGISKYPTRTVVSRSLLNKVCFTIE